jgi:hypothetical protein
VNEVVVFDDAEALVIAHLTGVLSGVLVTAEVPETKPTSFMTVQRIGGIQQNLVTDGPLLVFQAWATDKATAYDLAKLARAYVYAMPGNSFNGTWVYKVTEVGGLGYFPDPTSEMRRYQFTVQMRTRGTAL